MTLDAALTLIEAALIAPLLVLLAIKRIFRTLPWFVAYLVYGLLASSAGAAAIIAYPSAVYLRFWILSQILGMLLYLCILAESGKNVLPYNRVSHSKWPSAIFLFLLITPSLWSLAPAIEPPHLGQIWRFAFATMQATDIIQMSGLVTLITWSSLQRLHWPERELRVVTGVGSSAFVEFAVFILHSHGFIGPRFHWLDLLPAVCGIGALAYWLHYFWLEPSAATLPRALSGA